MSEPIGPVWTSPETWVDPSCIECGGSGAPCCDPPDHPYPTDPVTLVYVEAVAKMAGKVDALFDEIDRLRAQREAVLKLHPREVVERYAGPPNITCGHCMASSRHRAAWPCPTARALGVTDA
jgi:hypothetical protein